MKARRFIVGSGALALLGLGGCAGFGPSQSAISPDIHPITRVTGRAVTADMHYQYGKDALARGQVRAAMAHFRGALNIDGNHVDAVNGLAIAYSLEGRNEVAIGLLRSALIREPNSPMLMGNLSRSLMRANKMDEARAVLDAALKKEPPGTAARASLEAMDREMSHGVLARGPVVRPAPVDHPPLTPQPLGRIVSEQHAQSPRAAAQTADSQARAATTPVVPVQQVKRPMAASPALSATTDSAPVTGPVSQVVAAPDRASLKSPPDYVVVTAEQSTDMVVRVAPGLYELREHQVAQAKLPRLTLEVLQSTAASRLIAAAGGTGSETSPSYAPRAQAPIASSDPAQRSLAQEVPRVAPQVTPGSKASSRPGSVAVGRGPNPRHVDVQYANIEVSNGVGINGLAARWTGKLREHGADVVRITNYENFRQTETIIYYRRGFSADARDLAAKLAAVKPRIVQSDSLRDGVDVRLVLGRDATNPVIAEVAPSSGQESAWLQLDLFSA